MAQRWLAVEKKSLDLGFARLVPLPYRQNFFEVLCVKFSRILFFIKSSKPTRERGLAEIGFYRELCNVDSLAVDPKKHYLSWSLSVLPSKEFQEKSDAAELNKRNIIGATAYLQRVLKLLNNAHADVMALFEHYLDRVFIPGGKVADSQRTGGPVLLPSIKPADIRPKPVVVAKIKNQATAEYERLVDDGDKPYREQKKQKRLPAIESLFGKLARLKPSLPEPKQIIDVIPPPPINDKSVES